MESALTTSPPSRRASSTPRSDLPTAVGPTTATTGGRAVPSRSGTLVPADHRVADAVRRLLVVPRAAHSRLDVVGSGGERTGRELPRRASVDHELLCEDRVDGGDLLRVGGR